MLCVLEANRHIISLVMFVVNIPSLSYPLVVKIYTFPSCARRYCRNIRNFRKLQGDYFTKLIQ